MSRVRLYGVVASELRFRDFKNTTQKTEGLRIEVAGLEHLVADALQSVMLPDGVPIGHFAIGHHPLDNVAQVFSQSMVS